MSLLGLVPDYGNDSSSSSDSESDDDQIGGINSVRTQEKETLPLPLPNLEPTKVPSSSTSKELSSRVTQSSSVFYNPYLAKEKAKLSVLEQHVQLSQTKPAEKEKKTVCWKFKKGKCRFGDKCRFGHGTEPGNAQQGKEDDASPAQVPALHVKKQRVVYEADEEEAQWEEKKTKRKRRVGVTDSLVPPKRAVQAYEQQQLQEKPWTCK